MKIAIIGAGFTGLTSAYFLTKNGHDVTVFEKDPRPGGLAIGFYEKNWEWSLESHYHHWFTNDNSVLSLAQEIDYPVVMKRPKTSVYIDHNILQLDSPLALLRFSKLSLLERFRMAAVLGFLRYNPFWKPLERFHTTSFLQKSMGKRPYEMIWEPQLRNKFGSYIDTISLAWFWARIKKRTSSLAYPTGGFLDFASALAKKVEEQGGIIHYNTETTKITSKKQINLTIQSGSKQEVKVFDRVIVTLPSFLFQKLAPDLPKPYVEKLTSLKGLGAINLVLRLSKPFLPDNTYWLSICEKKTPVMAVVEHTNFMDKSHYNNEHIVYLGNYLPMSHPYFSYDGQKLLHIFDPFLKQINPSYEKNVIGVNVFKAPFAQPIIPTNYSRFVPPLVTPLPNVYLANMQQVYPWDRGTNYAVELGGKVASLIT